MTRYRLRGTNGAPATAPRYEQNALVIFPFQAIVDPGELGGTTPRDEVRTFVARHSLRTSTMEGDDAINTAGKQFDLRIDANTLKITNSIPE